MTKYAYVKFERTVVFEVDGEKSEDEIVQEAVNVWNEYMELDDIMMDEDHCVNIRIVEE